MQIIGRIQSLVAASVLGLLATGCVSAVDLVEATSPLTPNRYTEIGEAEGSSSGFSVFMLQFGASDAIGEARDRAITSMQADALVRVSVDSRDFYFFNLFGLHRATVRGTAVRKSP